MALMKSFEKQLVEAIRAKRDDSLRHFQSDWPPAIAVEPVRSWARGIVMESINKLCELLGLRLVGPKKSTKKG